MPARSAHDEPIDTPSRSDLARSDLARSDVARSDKARNDIDRVTALDRYAILDTPAEAAFDDIVALVADVFEAPIAIVNLIAQDRQWFKAEIGIGARELPLDVSLCAHALEQGDTMIVPDTRLDTRFEANPLVTAANGLHFYAGALLRTPEGVAIGTVCVLDRKSRPDGVTERQRRTLEIMARQVMMQLELRQSLARQRADDRRNRLILESAVEYGIVSMAMDGTITSWNEGAVRLMGWTEAEVIGHPCDAFFTPEDRAAGVPALEMGNTLRTGKAIDERWHLRKDQTQFWASGEMMPLTDDDDRPVGFLKILRDRTEQRLAVERQDEHRALLMSELQHRMKNTLAIVQGIVSQSLRTVSTPAEARDAIGDRLATLAKANDLLTQSSWTATPARAVVDGAIAVLGSRRSRVHVSGEPLFLTARAALALAMVIHELCTNALKYGALSNMAGDVQFGWTIRGDVVEVEWLERGGPPVASPERSGFGSKLIQSSLARDLGGAGRIEYRPGGVCWTLNARRAAIEDAVA